MKLQELTLSLFVFMAMPFAQADDMSWILCDRKHEVYAVDPRFTSKDPCIGTVKIQGISYKCGKMEETVAKTQEFLAKLKVNAKKKCEDYCESKGGDSCKGIFTQPEKCGWWVPPHLTEKVGRDVAMCNPKCEGTAFIYCSIYHASYLRAEDHLFKNKDPNCICKRSKD